MIAPMRCNQKDQRNLGLTNKGRSTLGSFSTILSPADAEMIHKDLPNTFLTAGESILVHSDGSTLKRMPEKDHSHNLSISQSTIRRLPPKAAEGYVGFGSVRVLDAGFVSSLTVGQRSERVVSEKVIREQGHTCKRSLVGSSSLNNLIKKRSNKCPLTSYGGCLTKRPLKKRGFLTKLTVRKDEISPQYSMQFPGDNERVFSFSDGDNVDILDKRTTMLKSQQPISSSQPRKGGNGPSVRERYDDISSLRPWSERNNILNDAVEDYWKNDRSFFAAKPPPKKGKHEVYAPVISFPLSGGEENIEFAETSSGAMKPRPLSRVSLHHSRSTTPSMLTPLSDNLLSLSHTHSISQIEEPLHSEGSALESASSPNKSFSVAKVVSINMVGAFQDGNDELSRASVGSINKW